MDLQAIALRAVHAMPRGYPVLAANTTSLDFAR
jgi:hypothetical protein